MEPVIVGIPGPWADHEELFAAVMAAGMPPRFMLVGPVMMELDSKKSFKADIYGPNPQMAQIMMQSSGGSISVDLARQIGGHRSTVYLVSDDHDLPMAQALMRTAAFLMDLGGYAVKVESAGSAMGPAKWRSLCSDGSAVATMQAMVTLVGGDAFCYSCGMHNLGLPDCSVSTRVPGDAIAEVITAFNHWQLHGDESPAEGALFATELDGLVFEMRLEPFGYEEDSPLNNPFGRWHLEPTDRALDLEPAFSGDGQMFMGVRSDDPEMALAKERARAALGRLVTFASDPHDYGMALFKIHLRDGENSAHMWLMLTAADEQTVTGSLFELPPEFTGIDKRAPITVPHHEVEDWQIRKAGLVIGGFTTRIQRAKVDPARRRHFDLYSGNVAYAPLEELDG